MLQIPIPGFKALDLEHLVLDFNGTLSFHGSLIEGVRERLEALSMDLHLHVVTANTHARAEEELQGLPLTLTLLGPTDQAEAKRDYVAGLGADQVVCIGNGRNDRLMLREAALGIAVCGGEGAAMEALTAAHLFVPRIQDALDLLRYPQRLMATLRS